MTTRSLAAISSSYLPVSSRSSLGGKESSITFLLWCDNDLATRLALKQRATVVKRSPFRVFLNAIFRTVASFADATATVQTIGRRNRAALLIRIDKPLTKWIVIVQLMIGPRPARLIICQLLRRHGKAI